MQQQVIRAGPGAGADGDVGGGEVGAVRRLVAAVPDAERSAAAGAASTMSQIGYAVGFAASGIAVNASGLAASATPATAQQAASLLFAGFIPLGLMGLCFAYRLTRPHTWKTPPDRSGGVVST